MQPHAPPGQIALAATKKLATLRADGAQTFVVLIDCEDPGRCPCEFAKSIQQALVSLGWPGVHVVVKTLKFENWLIADVDALKGMRGRFQVTKRFEERVTPDKADNVVDATAELRHLSKGDAYHKRKDALEIAEHQEPCRVAENSRSFRRFLRVVGCRKYAQQSRSP